MNSLDDLPEGIYGSISNARQVGGALSPSWAVSERNFEQLSGWQKRLIVTLGSLVNSNTSSKMPEVKAFEI